MYKLIFADDEALVRNSLPKMIDWDEVGFELAGCCANGHALLETAEKIKPDLIITDINMPFISGLEAARQIRADFPNTRIVFLTGYDDFSYAQQAVDLKTDKYMVKPVNAESLRNMLSEIKVSLDKEYAFYSDLTMLKDFYNRNQSVIRNIFLNNLLLMSMSEEEVEERVSQLNIERLSGNLFCVALLQRDEKRTRPSCTQMTSDLEEFALYNIASELLIESRAGEVVMMNGRSALIFRTDETDEGILYRDVEKTLGEAISAVEKFLKFPVVAGFGRICTSRAEIHTSYNEASVALGYSQELGGNRIIFIDDVGQYKNNFLSFDIQKEKQFIDALRSCDRETMILEVARILDSKRFVGKGSPKLNIFDLLLGLFKEAQGYGIDARDVISPGKMVDLLEANTQDDLFLLLTGCCERIISGIQNRRRSTYSLYLEQAQNYIAEHYSDPELSIDVVCKHMNVSASHLRLVFRKEMNMAFIKYLNKVRLESARRLLDTTNLKNYEISEAVGFNAPHYFSYCFKQYFGMSPNELREKRNE